MLAAAVNNNSDNNNFLVKHASTEWCLLFLTLQVVERGAVGRMFINMIQTDLQ